MADNDWEEWGPVRDHLGQMVIWAAHVEYIFEALLCILVDGSVGKLSARRHTKGQIIFFNLKKKGLGSVQDTVRDLLPLEGYGHLKGEYKRISQQASRLMERRNEFVHNHVQFKNRLGEFGQMTNLTEPVETQADSHATGARVRRMEPLDLDKISELCGDLSAFCQDVGNPFLFEHFGKSIYYRASDQGL